MHKKVVQVVLYCFYLYFVVDCSSTITVYQTPLPNEHYSIVYDCLSISLLLDHWGENKVDRHTISLKVQSQLFKSFTLDVFSLPLIISVVCFSELLSFFEKENNLKMFKLACAHLLQSVVFRVRKNDQTIHCEFYLPFGLYLTLCFFLFNKFKFIRAFA